MHHFTIAANTAGERRTVVVHVYPTQPEMVRAARHFNGDPTLTEQTQAIVNAWHGKQNPQAVLRLCYESMHDHIFVHEIVHAAQIIYRWSSPTIEAPASEHFTFYNEQFAHLVSDLYQALREGIAARFTISHR